MDKKRKARFILISLGFICIGLGFLQFFLYDIEDLSAARSLVSLGSIFVIGVTSIISGWTIR
jgi:hypothetical protein